MGYDANKHHRRSLRLPGYDYAQVSAYFISVCTQGRECLFGDVTTTGEIVLNEAGRMIEHWWQELNVKYRHVITDAFVIMPNHFHGIVVITAAHDVRTNLCVGPADLRVGPVGPVDPIIHEGAHAGGVTYGDGPYLRRMMRRRM